MKRLFSLLCLLIILVACKTETKTENTKSEIASEETEELSVAEKIAQAHGIDNWKNVNQIEFTFNVNRGGQLFGRSWTWNPKTDDITLVSNEGTVNFNRTVIDSTSLGSDRAFINDKFWMLIPFQLVWDEGTTISEPTIEAAPISKTELRKITLTYGNEGGYTPGDAYDIFYDDEFMIREWVFRQGNSEEPSMTTTFENYEEFNGIKIAKDHKMAEGNFNLFFSNIKVN